MCRIVEFLSQQYGPSPIPTRGRGRRNLVVAEGPPAQAPILPGFVCSLVMCAGFMLTGVILLK